jgi:hypothetical protein
MLTGCVSVGGSGCIVKETRGKAMQGVRLGCDLGCGKSGVREREGEEDLLYCAALHVYPLGAVLIGFKRDVFGPPFSWALLVDYPVAALNIELVL